MPPSRPDDDDLLRPTLREEDDPARMRRAWNPWTLAILGVLGGALAAGVLYAENYRRLGKQKLFGAVLGLGLLVTIAGAFATLPLRTLEGFSDWKDEELMRMVQRGSGALLASLQNPRFRVFTGNGGEPGSLWAFGIGAVLVAGYLGNQLSYGILKWAS